MKTITLDSTKQPETENHSTQISFLKCPIDLLEEQNHTNLIPLEINDADNELTSKEKNFVEREQHLLAVANSVQDGIVSADNYGNIIFWNEGARKIFGYEEQEVVGQPLSIIMPEKYREAHKKGMRRYLQTGEKRVIGQVVELEGLRKDGSEFPLELSIGVWETEYGKYFTAIIRDNTEHLQSVNALRHSQSALDATLDGVFIFSPETLKFFYVNEGAIKQVGYTREELLQMTPIDIKPKFTDELFRRTIAPMIAGEKDTELFTTVHRHKNGTDIPVEIILQSVLNKAGERMFVGVARDITEREQAGKALRESENKLRILLDSMSEGLLQVDHNERIEYVNDRFCQMLGYKRQELIGKSTFEFLYDDEDVKTFYETRIARRKGVSWYYELKLKKKSGNPLYVIVGGAQLTNGDGKVTGTMGVFTDISARKRAEDQLLYNAFHDGLTGLANRTLFMDHLRMTIERSRSRHSNQFAILFLDFDRFKLVNDSLGHAVGDELLKQIARRLEFSTRTGDLTARLGGDEFVILLNELSDPGEAIFVAERVISELKPSFNLNGREVFISASIGIALSNTGYRRSEDMIRDADIAMYRAKSSGKAQFQVFDRKMHEQISNQLALETEMRRALENQEFEIHYQPIFNLKDESLKGFEALVRWRHPQRGLVPPLDFIPLAEENGLILPLGAWILNESCRQMNYWQKQNPLLEHLTISVNLSAKQFSQTDLAEQILETLEETGLKPACLRLEITESELMENQDAAKKMMNRLHALGVGWSLDDFGTGYSSLGYLSCLPVNFLKIDRSFIGQMTESKEKYEIVHTIIKLAESLNMKVIAEGIESIEQLASLNRLRCKFGQGYYFCKPLKASDVEEKILKDFTAPYLNQSGDFTMQLTL